MNRSAVATMPAASILRRFTPGSGCFSASSPSPCCTTSTTCSAATTADGHSPPTSRLSPSACSCTRSSCSTSSCCATVRVRVGLVAILVALQVTHAIVEPPADQYGTWANGTSAVPHAVGQPNLLHSASSVLGASSVAVSSLLSVAVLAALVLPTRKPAPTNSSPPERGGSASRHLTAACQDRCVGGQGMGWRQRPRERRSNLPQRGPA